MSEIPTRWYLKREPVGIVLVVEQVPAPHYGRCLVIESRREGLAFLRAHRWIVAAFGEGVPLVPIHTMYYDPVEDGG